MFEGSYSGTECFYFTSFALPHAGETPVEPHVHTWDAGVVTTQPSCTAAGVRTYTCTECGATRTESIAATGHTYGAAVVTTEPTCTGMGVRTRTCTVCGATTTQSIPSLGGHTWDEGTVTTEPTYETEGVRTYTCTRCGETYTESVAVIPPLCGDVNGDGIVNIRDINPIKKYLAGQSGSDGFVYVNADVDGDGIVNVKDVTALKNVLTSLG